MELSDEQLMTEVRQNKLDRLNVLFDRYQKRIYNYFLKSTLDQEDSSDLTQNVFVRVLKYRNSYRPGSNFQVWLFQIARNQVKDYFKKMKVYRDRFNPVEIMPDTADDDTDAAENERRLYLAMEKLPDDKRELLVLSKFQGLKYEQIAAIRTTSVSAVKVQVHRAIRQLRTIYFETTEQ